MNLLGCAAGDFSRDSRPITFFKNIRSLSGDIEIQCGCTDFEARGKSLFFFPSQFGIKIKFN